MGYSCCCKITLQWKCVAVTDLLGSHNAPKQGIKMIMEDIEALAPCLHLQHNDASCSGCANLTHMVLLRDDNNQHIEYIASVVRRCIHAI